MITPTIGQTVTFHCVEHVDGCDLSHTGTVTAIYEVTPTLTIVDFTDQHGEPMSVSTADVRVTA